MSLHFERDVNRLKTRVLKLGAMVEDNLRQAIQAVHERDAEGAAQVLETEEEIDHHEVEVEEECLKILALHQPVAGDLRLIITILKINHDLERIGDHAANIAERADLLSNKTEVQGAAVDLPRMGHLAQDMLRQCLDAFAHLDHEKARAVWMADAEVDETNRRAYDALVAAAEERPKDIKVLLSHLTTARQLERVADHATNIAKSVIYMAEGEIVRHRFRETH